MNLATVYRHANGPRRDSVDVVDLAGNHKRLSHADYD